MMFQAYYRTIESFKTRKVSAITNWGYLPHRFASLKQPTTHRSAYWLSYYRPKKREIIKSALWYRMYVLYCMDVGTVQYALES